MVDMEAAADRFQIADVLCRYAFAIDDQNWADLRHVFTPDCVAEYGRFGSFDGVEAVIAWMEPAHQGLTTQHAMANIVADVNGDAATARSYVTVTLQPAGAPMFRTGGQYVDALQRIDGAWRITRRSYSTIWEQRSGD